MQNSQVVINSLTLIILTLAVAVALVQIRKTLEWNQRHATQEIIFRHTVGDLFELRRVLMVKYGVDIHEGRREYAREADFRLFNDCKSLMKATKNDDEKELLALVRTVFNYYEDISLGIYNEVYDDQMLYETISLVLVRFQRWGEKYIQEEQKRIDPSLWINFEYKAREWRERLDRDQEENRAALRPPGKRSLFEISWRVLLNGSRRPPP